MAKLTNTTGSWQDALGSLLPADYQPQPEEPQAQEPAHKPALRIVIDKKRAGKTATIITGFDAGDSRADDLCALLKKRLATGGSARGGEILIQGDRRSQVAAILESEGYKCKQI